MRLQCGSCAATLAEKDVDGSRGLARCSFCGTLTDLGRRGEPGSAAAAFRERAEIPMPRGFSLSRGAGLVVVRRWFSPKFFFLLFFCLFWNGILVAMYAAALGGKAPPAFLLFPLIHVAIGVGLTYFTIAGFVNSTTVTASGGRLTVRHGPLPWAGNLDLGTAEVKQLFCTEKVTRGKNGPSYSYEVSYRGPGGETKTLLKGLDAPEQALFMEQRLEKHLRIEDRPVGGEIPR
jgi:hypothetical protein